MKIKDGFLVRTVGTECVVAAVGEQSRNFNGIIRLNDTAKFLWEQLQQETTEEQMVSALLESYEITEERAAADVKRFVAQLKEADILA